MKGLTLKDKRRLTVGPKPPKRAAAGSLHVTAAKSKRAAVVYVAVIARKDGPLPSESSFRYRLSSGRDDGGWFALMNTDKNQLIEDALKQVTKFGASRYEVWIGMLGEKVTVPTAFKVVKL